MFVKCVFLNGVWSYRLFTPLTANVVSFTVVEKLCGLLIKCKEVEMPVRGAECVSISISAIVSTQSRLRGQDIHMADAHSGARESKSEITDLQFLNNSRTPIFI